MRSEGVVLLHGHSRSPRSLARMERALRVAGYETLNVGYPSRRASVAALARDLLPEIQAFAAGRPALHFVGHSMGGLVARAIISQARPKNLGRVATLGTPHGGSEIADLLRANPVFRAWFGPAGDELGAKGSAALAAHLGPVDFPLGSIAGDRALNVIAARLILPRPNDGTVSVAATQIEGMADHRVIACNHTFLPGDARATALTLRFLREGRFG